MVIRKARVEDAAEIAALTVALGYAAEASAMAGWLARLSAAPEDVVYVAEVDGVVAGWVQGHTSVVLESGYRLEIVGLVVGEGFRRRGVGRKLVAAVEVWGTERGVNVFSVRSNVQRVESHAFYPALGYEMAKTQAVYRKRAAGRAV